MSAVQLEEDLASEKDKLLHQKSQKLDAKQDVDYIHQKLHPKWVIK